MFIRRYDDRKNDLIVGRVHLLIIKSGKLDLFGASVRSFLTHLFIMGMVFWMDSLVSYGDV